MLNWSGISRESVIGKLLRTPLAAVPPASVVPILAGPNRGFRWRVGACDHGCWLGSYEFEKQRAIWRAREEGATALDVGANVGFYTLLLSRAVGSSGSVVAIEPDSRNVAQLRWHVQANSLRNVQVVVGGVGSRSGIGSFVQGPTHSTGRVVDDGPGEQIRTYRLDEIAFGLDRHVPAIVKMDIEGGEAAALMGAEDLLGMRKTTWFVAVHSRNLAQQCMGVFRHHGYRVCALDGADLPPGYDGSSGELVAIPDRS
jgi:FkbM family methyltransferase